MSDSFSVRRLKSFGYARQGAKVLMATQPNAWIHAVATLTVIGGATFLRVTKTEWALLFGAVGWVWMAEAMNTAIEFLADEISSHPNPRIGRAKDVAAWGVLASALTATAIGAIVFVPHFF